MKRKYTEEDLQRVLNAVAKGRSVREAYKDSANISNTIKTSIYFLNTVLFRYKYLTMLYFFFREYIRYSPIAICHISYYAILFKANIEVYNKPYLSHIHNISLIFNYQS
jgi:hypothetical protein